MDDYSYLGDTSNFSGDTSTGYDQSGSTQDSLDAGNVSGTVAYNPQTTTQSTAGGVVNSASNPLTAPPDASGGSGSILTSLQNTLTQGLNDAAISATEFGLGALNDRLAVATGTGVVTPAAAQSRGRASVSLAANKGGWILIAALAAIVIYVATR
jgi:hypothetical protein